MDVSVVIPVYNAAALIEECIQSMLGQDFQGRFEVIAVDDCSTDESPRILHRLAAAAGGRLRILKTPVNGGYPAAMNLGIQAAQGKYIVRQDSDDRSHPSRLSLQFQMHEAYPEVAFVSCMRYWLTVHGKPFHAPPRPDEAFILESWQDLVGQRRTFTDPACMFLRERSIRVGGYNTYLRTGMDVDHWLRLMELTGQPCLNINKPLYGRRLIPNSLIYQPRTTYSNTIPRLFAQFRVENQLPLDTQPTEAWLASVRAEVPATPDTFRKVRLVMDTALVNLQMGDVRGFIDFFQVALSRNPLSALRFLAGNLLRGRLSDRLPGIPDVHITHSAP